MTRVQALELLHTNMQSVYLRRHCYAVEAVMRALAKKLGGDEDKWGIVGLLHDGDYEKTKDTPEKHTLLMYEWLKKAGADQEILQAILSHNYAHTGKNAPETKMEWALYCCDELTGLIIAVTLVHPEKKLASITVSSVKKKWGLRTFAAGVDRKQIEACQDKLDIPLNEFIDIALKAMQGIHKELRL